LPANIPYGVREFYCTDTNLGEVDTVFPNQLITMSFDRNTFLTYWLSTFPNNLGMLSMAGCTSISSLPVLPYIIKYIDLSYCSLPDYQQYDICNTLSNNFVLSGSLNLIGNIPLVSGALSNSIETRINSLRANSWDVYI
jgi:hypothetical protein